MSENEECPIWGTTATFDNSGGRDGKYVNSPRAGGKYFISGTAIACLANWSAEEKSLLTTWLIEQRSFGVETPEIPNEFLDGGTKRRPLSVFDRADGMLRYLDQKSQRIGHVVKWSLQKSETLRKANEELLAWTESIELSEVITLAEFCDEQKWVEYRKLGGGTSGRTPWHEIMLKPRGYAHIAELDGVNKTSTTCFVAMWFSDEVNSAYFDAIQPAIIECGYKPVRVDEIEYSGKIDDRIIAEIKRARFVVADFTSEKDKPRGGVYYEAGFAQGLNIPVIWTCHRDLADDIHFDIRQFNQIRWKNPEDLKEKLIVRIAAVIGDGPNKK